MSTDIELMPSSVAAFTEALKGERGSLDAWLEVNDEREVAAHVEAYARANMEPLIAENERLAEALRGLLSMPIAEAELRHLDKGIGTATRNAAWLRARAALRDHDQEGGNP